MTVITTSFFLNASCSQQSFEEYKKEMNLNG